MSELEQHYGLPGPTALQELLTTCEDPIEAIQSFQIQNSIQIPSLRPAMKLLDLHNVRRTEYHELVLGEVQERLISKVREAGQSKDKNKQKLVEELLDKSFPLFRVPQIRPIVLETMKQLPKVPDRYLKIVVADKDLYNDCAIKVRQQIWVKNNRLFLEAVEPLLDQYIERKNKMLRNVETGATATYFYAETTKARRQWAEIQGLVESVGDHPILYDNLLQLVRQRFLATKSVHYCSLRYEVLMALHDRDCRKLTELDPCHDFAWCLDPCLRDKMLHAQHAVELKSFLDTTKSGPNEKILCDIGMIAADPYLMSFLCSLVVKVLKDAVNNGTMPRDLSALNTLLRLINLGSNAWRILKQNKHKEIVIDSILYTKFLPDLMSIMAEDATRFEFLKAPLEPPEEIIQLAAESDYNSSPSDSMITFLKSEPLCCWILLSYLTDICPLKGRSDKVAITRIVKLLPLCSDKIALTEPWLNLLISRIIGNSHSNESLLTFEHFSTAMIDEFLVKELNDNPCVRYHLLRLLSHCHTVMTEEKRLELLELLNPSQLEESTENYVNFYEKVEAKLAQTLNRRRSSETSDV